MYKSEKEYPIKNTRVYKFAENSYCVSCDVRGKHEEFRGTREQVVNQMASRVEGVLHVRSLWKYKSSQRFW